CHSHDGPHPVYAPEFDARLYPVTWCAHNFSSRRRVVWSTDAPTASVLPGPPSIRVTIFIISSNTSAGTSFDSPQTIHLIPIASPTAMSDHARIIGSPGATSPL